MSKLHLSLTDFQISQINQFVDARKASNPTYATKVLWEDLLEQNQESDTEQVIWPPQFAKEPKKKRGC